jgi:tape measure domain-containing protein
MSTLSTNQIVVEYIIKEGDIQKAQQGFDKLSNAEKQAIVQTQKLNQTLKDTGTEGKRATDDVAGGLKNVGGMAGKLGPLIAGAFSIAAISAFTKQVIETTIKFEGYNKAIEFGSGSAENFAKNQEFLTNLINKYGLGLASATEAYKQFFTASTLAGQAQDETNRQFEAVTKAGTVLKLTTDQMQGAFMALGQMMSKGTVQAEELRGQLGERIPGAFSIMAKALNVNEQQLGKMLEQGQVLSKTALPAFATELEKTFGPAAERNLNGMVNSQNRFNNAIDNLILAVGNKLEPFLKGAYDLAAGIANQLSGIGEKVKTQTAENLGMKRAEADIVKQLIKYGGDLTVQNQKFIRQQEAVLLLLGMEEKIYNQQVLVTEKRIMAQNDFNGVATKALKDAESELNILIAEEKELEKIAGIEFKRGEDKKVLTDEEKKALENQYKIRLQNLELLKQIRQIELTLQGVPEASLIAEKEFLGKKYQLQLEYFGVVKELTETQIKLTGKQAEKSLFDLKQYYEGLKMVNKTATADFAKENTKVLDAEQDAGIIRMKNWSKMYEANLADEVKAKKKAEKEKAEATQIYYDLVGNSVQSLFDIQQQNIQNELTSLNQKYSEEIRLAGDNQQKVLELKKKQEAEEKALRTKAFKAQQLAAVSQVIFNVAPIIAKQIAGVVTAPLAIASYAAAAFQIGLILAQPVPEFKEGTKGKPFKGGKAIVGEIGKEWVVTTSGQVYETPGVATLVDLPKGSQVIPHHEVIKSERFMGSKLMNQGRGESGNGQLVERLISIENTLSKLPITSLTMDERGFTKKIQTKSRETRILNNRFGN